jgi:hypothetical protein
VAGASIANFAGCGQSPDGDSVDLLAPPPKQPLWDTESVTDEAESTHLWIVNRALDILARHKGHPEQQAIPLDVYLDVFRSDSCRSAWEQGLYDADFLSQYSNGDQVFPHWWKSHFYDPTTGTNYDGETSPTALTESLYHFSNAIALARQGNWANPNQPSCSSNPYGSNGCVTSACYEFGLSLHYMTDVTQPMHAANYTSGNSPLYYHSRLGSLDFGGAYGYIHGGTLSPNPATGGASCPSGYTAYQAYGTNNVDWGMWYCYRPHRAGRDALYDFGGAYGYVDGGTPANNPLTGARSCPAGYTDQMVLGTLNVDYDAHICYRPHQSTGTSLDFGGMFGIIDAVAVPNPATATFACPSGFTLERILGTDRVDWPLYSCYRTPPALP